MLAVSFILLEIYSHNTMNSSKQRFPFRSWMTTGCGVAMALVGVTLAPLVQAQSSPEMISFASGSAEKVEVRGFASATVPLYQAIAERDSNQQRCMGYGALTPDHVLDLKGDVSQLKLRIASRGQDTTLVVQGPGDRLICADDAPEGGKDAGIDWNNAKAGTYKVWVGAFDAGNRFRYTLNAETKN
jgi:hypothetical protein